MPDDEKTSAGDDLKPGKGYINTVNDASITKEFRDGKEVTPAGRAGRSLSGESPRRSLSGESDSPKPDTATEDKKTKDKKHETKKSK